MNWKGCDESTFIGLKRNQLQAWPKQGFFPRGDWGSPSSHDSRPHFLTRACPPNWVLSLKISKIVPHFALNFDYFLAQNYIRKLLKIC